MSRRGRFKRMIFDSAAYNKALAAYNAQQSALLEERKASGEAPYLAPNKADFRARRKVMRGTKIDFDEVGYNNALAKYYGQVKGYTQGLANENEKKAALAEKQAAEVQQALETRKQQITENKKKTAENENKNFKTLLGTAEKAQVANRKEQFKKKISRKLKTLLSGSTPITNNENKE